jgi:hypothetical protein
MTPRRRTSASPNWANDAGRLTGRPPTRNDGGRSGRRPRPRSRGALFPAERSISARPHRRPRRRPARSREHGRGRAAGRAGQVRDGKRDTTHRISRTDRPLPTAAAPAENDSGAPQLRARRTAAPRGPERRSARGEAGRPAARVAVPDSEYTEAGRKRHNRPKATATQAPVCDGRAVLRRDRRPARRACFYGHASAGLRRACRPTARPTPGAKSLLLQPRERRSAEGVPSYGATDARRDELAATTTQAPVCGGRAVLRHDRRPARRACFYNHAKRVRRLWGVMMTTTTASALANKLPATA